VKLKLFFIFIAVFVLIFAVLNSRFIYANAKFWLQDKAAHEQNPPKSESTPKKQLSDKATLVIDGIGVRAPIIFGTGDASNDIYKNLENGVAHYSGTPRPGMDGVSIILGHSSAYPWYKGAYGSVFALLGKLKAGDKIYVEYDDGQTFAYSVKQSIVFSPLKDDVRLDQIEKSDRPTLVLVSCWPIGTNYKRIAIEAELL
jgi:LPXTG-site transpeptidase (sortase) family protein